MAVPVPFKERRDLSTMCLNCNLREDIKRKVSYTVLFSLLGIVLTIVVLSAGLAFGSLKSYLRDMQIEMVRQSAIMRTTSERVTRVEATQDYTSNRQRTVEFKQDNVRERLSTIEEKVRNIPHHEDR